MVSFAALRDARLSSLAEAAEAWRSLAARLQQTHEQVVKLQKGVRESWTGRDADAAYAQMQMLREKTYSACQTTRGVGMVLSAAHQRFKAAQDRLHQAIEQAHDYRMTVGEDGSLRFPRTTGPTTVAEQTLMQQHGTAVRTQMESALRAANDADKRVTEALAALSPEVLSVGAAGMDPRQNAYRAMWMANPHDVDGRRSLADIIKQYQISKDPRGMTEFPDGFLKWLGKQIGQDPEKVTAGEKDLLNQLLAAEGYHGLREFENDRNSAADGPPKWMPQGRYDGHGDAWRHAYWNALMTRDFGEEWTESFAISHERISYDNPGPREAMDLYNNEVGRRIALQHPDATNEELAAYVRQAVNDGRMLVIGQDGQLNWSDQVPKGHTMPEPRVTRLPEYGPGRPPSEVGH